MRLCSKFEHKPKFSFYVLNKSLRKLYKLSNYTNKVMRKLCVIGIKYILQLVKYFIILIFIIALVIIVKNNFTPLQIN